MVDLPEPEKRGVPAYMVSFGDMITLLLTFFILLVALADTQEAGLIAAGRGPIIKHIMSQGTPGVMSGRLSPNQVEFKRDTWWIPNQEGDPDELEVVADKLERELPVLFKPGEAAIEYEKDRLVLRIPARITFDRDTPEALSQAAKDVLDTVAMAVATDPDRRIRINGDVEMMHSAKVELAESARNGRLVYQYLRNRHGIRPHQMSLWGWGSSRLRLPSSPTDPRNRAITLEIFDPPRPAADAQGGSEETSDGR